MNINLIFARSANGVIGRDGNMPWHLPEDLAHFKRLTQGLPVIMGRKTWDSLPPKFRPLPGRTNIVITRQQNWLAQGAQVAHSLAEALTLCGRIDEAWVIGGAQIYAEALPLAVRVEVTEIAQHVAGDAFAPALDASWIEMARHAQVSSTGMGFSFVSYARPRLIQT